MLYMSLNQTYDVIVPAFRGIQATVNASTRGLIICSTLTTIFSIDQLGSINCQVPGSQWGDTYTGFSVDQIAKDNLKIIATIKQDKPLYVFARGFGSYVLNRMLLMNSSLIDAVMIDSVWSPNTTVTDWDIQRNTMGKSIMAQLKNATKSRLYSEISRVTLNVQGMYDNLLDAAAIVKPICGQSFVVPGFAARLQEAASYSILHPSFRPRFLAAVLQLNRCVAVDYGTGLNFFYAVSLNPAFLTRFIKFVVPVDITFVSNHIIMSELMDYSRLNNDDAMAFSGRSSSYVRNLRSLGWKLYPQSSLWGVTANYTKPMLMMNGEYNPQSTIDQATQFAKSFTSPNQQLIIMPGMPSDSYLKSYVLNGETQTCGMNLVAQFVNCPTCVIDTSCTSIMTGLTYDGDALTTAAFGDPLATFYIPPYPSAIASCIVFAITAPFPIIIFILLLVFHKSRRVRSRLFAPHLGLAYVLTQLIVTCTIYGGLFVSLPLNDIGVMIQDALFVVSCLIFVIQTIRFFALTAIYRRMATQEPNGKFIKFLVSWKLLAGSVIAVGTIWALFGIAMIVCHYYIGYYKSVVVLIYATVVVCAGLAILAIICLIYDFISQAITTRCNIREYFYQGDPLLFRFDSALLPAILVFGVIGNVMFTVGTMAAQADAKTIVALIFTEIYLILLMLYFGGNVVIMCIVDKIRGRTVTRSTNSDNKEMNEEDEIRQLFEDEIGNARLLKYCSNEFSLENALAWKEMDVIRSRYDQRSHQENTETLKHFYDKYLVRGVDMELNIVANLVKRYKIVIDAPENEIDNAQRKRVIVEMCDAVMGNLLDTYSRFRVTKEYEECQKAMEISRQIKSRIAV
jgi:hypothetical protein